MNCHKIYYLKRRVKENLLNFLPYLWMVLGVLSILLIIIIVYTDFRLGEFEKAKEYNEFILALFVGIFASCFFYWINEYIPHRELNKTMKGLIDNELKFIYNKLTASIWLIYNPFQDFFKKKRIPKLDQFLKDFEKFDFNEIKYENKTYKQIFIQNQKIIRDRGRYAMSEYNRFMFVSQLKYIRNILNSTFIYQELDPLEQGLPDEVKIDFPNNQREIGASLFKLYKLKLPR